jgi:CheY-like chemotaxis protein
MRGELNVKSHPGKGSTFFFKLRVNGRMPGKPFEPELKRTILLRSDSKLNLEIILAWLEFWELPVKVIASDEELEKDINTFDKNIIAMCDLSHENGDFERIRKLNAVVKKYPAIFLVSVAAAKDLSDELARKACVLVPKPFIHYDILRAVAELLDENSDMYNLKSMENVAEKTSGFSHRILLVEDNLVNLKFAQILLEKFGCSVETAINGVEACEQALHNDYDLIFMDCQMAVMDGLKATMKIRQFKDAAKASVPIVAMTANAMAGDRETCINAGMNDYISKPVTRERIMQVLEEFKPK